MIRPDLRSVSVTLVRLQSLHPVARYGHWLALVLMLLIPVVMGVVLWNIFDDPQARERLWRALTESLWQKPDMLVAAIVAPFILLYLAVEQPARLKDRIMMDATGIAFQRLARWRLPLTPRPWSIPWTRLRKAELRVSFGPAVLMLSDGVHVRRIIIDEWVAPDTPPEAAKQMLKQSMQRRQKRIPPEEALRLAEESPLLQALRARGVTIQRPDASSPLVFDLFKNRHAVIAVALLAVIGVYGVFDLVLLDETYAGLYPWIIWVLVGVAAAVLAYRWLSGAQLPSLVAFVLAMMIGLDTGFAMYPGLLRLNQLTGTAGAQPHEYLLREYVRLEPVEADLPVIEFRQAIEYWQQFKPGSSHTLYLRHGGLGFYQIDLAPVYAETREFYEKRNTHSPAERKNSKESSPPA
jgi:hypothetical protein